MEDIFDLAVSKKEHEFVRNGLALELDVSADMHICFGIFLYNMEMRRVNPVVACEKIKLAIDQRFSCYDREEESISLRNYDYMRMGYGY